MRLLNIFFLTTLLFSAAHSGAAQQVVRLQDTSGLHAAYVVPRDDLNRVDMQLIVLSGAYDDPALSGTAHLTEHLAAFSADRTVLRQQRARDLNAQVFNVSTLYTNTGAPSEIDTLMKLSRSVLQTPDLPADFAESEVDILRRETLLRERQAPTRWLRRAVLQNLYGEKYGRANNDVEDLARLNIKTAMEFHAAHYVPSNVTLIISGRIEVDVAQDLVTRYFGDTAASDPPAKPWLDQKPEPSLRIVERLTSDRLNDDVVLIAKHVDFVGQETSIDMQGAFFLASAIINDRISKAIRFEDTSIYNGRNTMYFSKAADIEIILTAHPMPTIGLDTAMSRLETALARILETPITPDEIAQARRQQLANAEFAKTQPSRFLRFLHNVAADGFAPLSPDTFAEEINQTTDEEVVSFVKTVAGQGATSILLAKKAR